MLTFARRVLQFSGWSVFLKDNWDTATFVTNYLPLILFPIFYIGAKIWKRVPPRRPEEMDFVTNIKEIEAEMYDEPVPRNWVERFWGWLVRVQHILHPRHGTDRSPADVKCDDHVLDDDIVLDDDAVLDHCPPAHGDYCTVDAVGTYTKPKCMDLFIAPLNVLLFFFSTPTCVSPAEASVYRLCVSSNVDM